MPSNEIKSVVESNVRIDHAAGSIVSHDPFTATPDRLAIMDNELALGLLRATGSSDGEPMARFGDMWGQLFYEGLAASIESAKLETVRRPQDFLKEEFVEDFNAYFSYAGIGQFRIMEGNKFYAIDILNPAFKDWPDTESSFKAILEGFFAGLFSRMAERPLYCLFLATDESRWRFALSKEAIIEEIRSLLAAGKTYDEIVGKYRNEHFA